MDFDTFVNFHQAAGDAGLLYYYAGHFDEEVRRSLSASLKTRLEEEEAAGARVKKKVFSTVMEMAQNVLHYGGCIESGDNEATRPGAIAVGRDGDSYWIVCGNLVPREQVERLTGKLDQINRMSLEEIKAAYREQLANDAHTDQDAISKGAGLGLLTIARDSVHPIEYTLLADEASQGRYARLHLKAFV